MRFDYLLAAAALAIAACHSGSSSSAEAAPGTPMVSTAIRTPADSLYAQVLARLEKRHYRIDAANAKDRRLVVRAPDDATRVEVRIVSKGDSSTVAITPLGAADAIAAMGSLIMVTYDATVDSTDAKAPPRR